MKLVSAAWHNWKTRNDHFYRKANDIAEMHGDGRPHRDNAYLFFSMEELIEGSMGFYGKKAINEALALLVSLEVVSIHQNPNPRYLFDKTKYFKFYPEICNQWIANHYPTKDEKSDLDAQGLEYSDKTKVVNRLNETSHPLREKDQPSGESSQAITNTTNNTTNNIQSIKRSDEMVALKSRGEIQTIVDALVKKGFPEKRFNYPDASAAILDLKLAGATPQDFIEAYDRALEVTQSEKGRAKFGVNYLVKSVKDLLERKKGSSEVNRPTDQPDYNKALHWMGDLVD